MFRLLLATLLAAIVSCAAAQTPQHPAVERIDPWVLRKLILAVGRSADRIVEQLRPIFIGSANASGLVTGEGLAELERIDAAAQRASLVQHYLAFDLDGDGVVSRAELEQRLARQFPGQRPVLRERRLQQLLRADADGDGLMTFEEIRQHVARETLRPSRRAELLVPLSLDRDGDGAVSWSEFEAAVRAGFAIVDANGDGVLSREEVLSVAMIAGVSPPPGRPQRERQTVPAECRLPIPSAAARLVAVSAYEGSAMSSASIGGDGITVQTSAVTVEEGQEPLFLVLSSYTAQVWQISGAVHRIEGVVLSSSQGGEDQRPRVGVTGIERDKVHIAPRIDCIPVFYDTRREEGRPRLQALFGRQPDVLAGRYSIGLVAVPSGRIEAEHRFPGTISAPPAGAAAEMWREFLRFNPSGLVRIEPGSVVADLPVRAYRVWPQQAGLAQLIETGALTVAGHNRVIDLRDMSEQRGVGRLRVVDQITFPAGLHGAHSTSFVIARGAPNPSGDPGHSSVFCESTGRQRPRGGECPP